MTLREEILKNSNLLSESPVKHIINYNYKYNAVYATTSIGEFKVTNKKDVLLIKGPAGGEIQGDAFKEVYKYIKNGNVYLASVDKYAQYGKYDVVFANTDTTEGGIFDGDEAKSILELLIKKISEAHFNTLLNTFEKLASSATNEKRKENYENLVNFVKAARESTLKEESLNPAKKSANEPTVEQDFDTDSKRILGLIYKSYLKYKASIESHKNMRGFVYQEFEAMKEEISDWCDDILDTYEGEFEDEDN